MTDLETRLARIFDKDEIRDVLAAYVRGVDRGDEGRLGLRPDEAAAVDEEVRRAGGLDGRGERLVGRDGGLVGVLVERRAKAREVEPESARVLLEVRAVELGLVGTAPD